MRWYSYLMMTLLSYFFFSQFFSWLIFRGVILLCLIDGWWSEENSSLSFYHLTFAPTLCCSDASRFFLFLLLSATEQKKISARPARAITKQNKLDEPCVAWFTSSHSYHHSFIHLFIHSFIHLHMLSLSSFIFSLRVNLVSQVFVVWLVPKVTLEMLVTPVFRVSLENKEPR